MNAYSGKQPDIQNGHEKPEKPKRVASFGLGTRITVAVVMGSLLVFGLGGWAATAKLSGAVIAQGTVAVDKHVKEIQHRDGGIVAEIAVDAGDAVRKGQMLLRLDDAETHAELSIIRTQLVEMAGLEARLLAERDGLDEVVFNDGYIDRPGAASIAQAEVRLFEGNMERRRSQKEQLELQIAQIHDEAEGLRTQLSAKNDELELMEAEHSKILGLAEKGYAERSRVDKAKREIVRLLGERGEIVANIARAEGRVSEIRLQIISIDNTARTEAQSELRSVTAKVSELREREIAVEDRLARTDLRAPLSGTVNDLNVHTIGGVITPAQQVLTIVPEDAELKVEVRIAPRDIDKVYVGQTARLRFTSFNQRTTPEIEGTVSHLPAAATVDAESREAFYRGYIDITGDLSVLEDGKLLPGMPVEVFIQTEHLAAISYLAKPFSDQVTRAFREE